MTNYEYDDLMLQFEQMRAQGWDPLLCDTLCPTTMAVCRTAIAKRLMQALSA